MRTAAAEMPKPAMAISSKDKLMLVVAVSYASSRADCIVVLGLHWVSNPAQDWLAAHRRQEVTLLQAIGTE